MCLLSKRRSQRFTSTVSYNIPFHNGCAMKACSTRGKDIINSPQATGAHFLVTETKISKPIEPLKFYVTTGNYT